MSAVFICLCDFDGWNISGESMTAFEKDKRSYGNKEANQKEKEMCETLGYIKSRFHFQSMLSLHLRGKVMKL